MNVVFVTPEYPGINPSGGLGSYVRNMSEALSRRGHHVAVITPTGSELSLRDCRDGVDIEAPFIAPYQARPFLSRCRFLWRFQFDFPKIRCLVYESRMICDYLRRYLNTHDVDVIHFAEYRGFAFNWALRSSKVPYVIRLSSPTRYVQELNGDSLTMELRILNWMELLPIRCCNAVYAPTRSILEYVSPWVPRGKGKGLVIPSPVDTNRFFSADRSSSRNVILVTGRVERRKGAMLVAEALPQLFRQNNEVSVCWVGGDTPTAPGWTSMVQWIRSHLAPDQQSRFVWREAVPFDEMPNVYRNARLFWIPSIHDNLPNTGLEAMASGLPVIASDQSGMQELITDGGDGVIFPSGDAKALCQRTIDLLDDTGTRIRIGNAARVFAQDALCFAVVSEKVEILLQSVSCHK